MPSEQPQAPEPQRYHVLVRTPEQSGAVAVELTADEFLKLEADLCGIGSPQFLAGDREARVDIRLVHHRPGHSGRAERVNPAKLRLCLDNNSYLRTDVLATLRSVTKVP